MNYSIIIFVTLIVTLPIDEAFRATIFNHMITSFLFQGEDNSLQPLPPLKKVLSRNRYLRPHLTQISQSEEDHQAHLESLGIHTETEQIEISTEEIEIGTNDDIKTELSDFIIQEETIKTEVPDGNEGLMMSEEEQESDSALHDSDYENGGDKSRNSLPHKKRIPRKLKHPKKSPQSRNVMINTYKCSKCSEIFTSVGAFAVHKATHSVKRPYQSGVSQTAPSSFSCELCFKNFTNQWKFFEHLKSHYEPLELDSSPTKQVHTIQNKANSAQSDTSPKKDIKLGNLKVRGMPPGPTQPATGRIGVVSVDLYVGFTYHFR